MRINEIIWKQRFQTKIEQKHAVTMAEVEDVLFGKSLVRRIEKGRIAGEHLYVAYGRSGAGRYLVVFFVHKANKVALPITAREMTHAERRYYEKQS